MGQGRQQAQAAQDRCRSIDPKVHIGLINAVARRAAGICGEPHTPQDLLGDSYIVFDKLMRWYDPAKSRVSTTVLRYGPHLAARRYLSRELTWYQRLGQASAIVDSGDERVKAREDREPMRLHSAGLTGEQYETLRMSMGGVTIRRQAQVTGADRKKLRQLRDSAAYAAL